ncbi:hypothetical protein PHMEG_00013577 [Phytophthora megakarya]|uniref:MULE transposase domain-containing protein n=1 Tax=Phytophthora megakarya TaxID=4795 RepID=A0A225W6E3_9STRA|nr:hypothetical protein PHMEG_00013577 [Phytophthora megakarya]
MDGCWTECPGSWSTSTLLKPFEAISFIKYFNVFYTNDGKRQRMVGMGHPDLIRLLTYPGVSIFIDGTFSITPKPFKQTIIVMCHDTSYDVYIPAKGEWTHWHCLDWARVLGKMKMTPASITRDFEAALINAVHDQFSGTQMVGILFHWKQAIRRKLVELRIPANQIEESMSAGAIDVLTVIPI